MKSVIGFSPHYIFVPLPHSTTDKPKGLTMKRSWTAAAKRWKCE